MYWDPIVYICVGGAFIVSALCASIIWAVLRLAALAEFQSEAQKHDEDEVERTLREIPTRLQGG
jgi:hypothetical protein